MAIRQIRYRFKLIALLRIAFPAVGVSALLHRPLLIAARVFAVARPVGPSGCNRLQMRCDRLTLAVQPPGYGQIDRFGTVEQTRFVIHLVILEVRAVLLEIFRQLLLGILGQRSVRLQLDIACVEIERYGLHIVILQDLVILLHILTRAAHIAGTAGPHDIAAIGYAQPLHNIGQMRNRPSSK